MVTLEHKKLYHYMYRMCMYLYTNVCIYHCACEVALVCGYTHMCLCVLWNILYMYVPHLYTKRTITPSYKNYRATLLYLGGKTSHLIPD